jgi:hypothetical protein
MGDGWWAWCIPLKGGDVSVGVVFDQRLVRWPENGSLGGRLKEFLVRHPAGRELMADAQWVEGDVHWRKNLPYSSTVYAGDGFALVGDAAAFIDPFYSPGMDWISFTVLATVGLISAQQNGMETARLLEEHNRAFRRSYTRWFEAVYKDKYEYMGDFELMKLAFVLDLGLYYAGVASQPYKYGLRAFSIPVFSNLASSPAFHLMRLYNARLARIARNRRLRNQLGRANHGRRFMFQGYTFSPTSLLPVAKALAAWARLELTEGWRTWLPEKVKARPESGGATPARSEAEARWIPPLPPAGARK